MTVANLAALIIVVCNPALPPPIICQVIPGRAVSTDLTRLPTDAKPPRKRVPTWGPKR